MRFENSSSSRLNFLSKTLNIRNSYLVEISGDSLLWRRWLRLSWEFRLTISWIFLNLVLSSYSSEYSKKTCFFSSSTYSLIPPFVFSALGYINFNSFSSVFLGNSFFLELADWTLLSGFLGRWLSRCSRTLSFISSKGGILSVSRMTRFLALRISLVSTSGSSRTKNSQSMPCLLRYS